MYFVGKSNHFFLFPMNFWGHAGDWMLVLHFGSCLGCIEPVLIEWSVSCPGGLRGSSMGAIFFRVSGTFPKVMGVLSCGCF